MKGRWCFGVVGVCSLSIDYYPRGVFDNTESGEIYIQAGFYHHPWDC